MMKRILLTFAMLLSMGFAMAQTSNQQIALEAALRATKSSDLTPLSSAPKMNNIFCFKNDTSFVIATSDSRFPIIGYSSSPITDGQELPPALVEWMQAMDQQIDSNALEPLRKNGHKDRPNHVAPLLTTAWAQSGSGYNSQCPYDSALNGQPLAGCIAVAMGQVIR